jgi:hypothetical protein
MKTRFLLAVVLSGGVCLHAAPLTESTFTEIIKEVNVVPQATKTAKPAQVQEVVKAPDLVRTGPASRAELTAPDQTLTRIGANTVFSFEPTGRNLNLQQGSVLFHSPAGKGGGSIRSGGASAAVLGTTLIVAASENGGFKVILLEGRGRVTLANGDAVVLLAGQMVFVLPGEGGLSPVLNINLGKLVAGSLLVTGFSHDLPSSPKIHAAVEKQDHEIAIGRAQDTGEPADSAVGKMAKRRGGSGRNGVNTLDNTVYQANIGSPISAGAAAQLASGQGVAPRGVNPGGRGIAIIGPK